MRQNLSVTYADNSQNSSLSGESRPLENHFKKQSLKKVNPEITIRPKLLTIEELPREYAPSVSIPLKSLDWEGQVPSKVNWQAMENIPKQTSFAEGNT